MGGGIPAAVAVALDDEDVGVMDDAVDEGGGAGSVGEDGGPLAERQVGGEDEALALVAAAHDLEEEVGVAVVVGEVADLVDHEKTRSRAVVAEALVEGARALLCTEIEEQLGSGDEDYGVAGEDGLVGDVLGDHGLAEALGRDEDDVPRGLQEFEAQGRLDRCAIDALRPVPVEVGHRLEAPEAAPREAALEAAACTLLGLDLDDVEVEAALKLPRIRKYLRGPDESLLWLADLAALADLAGDTGKVRGVCRDPEDDAVLCAAIEGRAAVIVTGDADLLALEEPEGIPIVTPRAFLDLIKV